MIHFVQFMLEHIHTTMKMELNCSKEKKMVQILQTGVHQSSDPKIVLLLSQVMILEGWM